MEEGLAIMKYLCLNCNRQTKDEDTVWLSADQTRKEGQGIDTKRYCLKCGGMVRGCFNILRSVSPQCKNEAINTEDMGCDKCYGRFRCFTE